MPIRITTHRQDLSIPLTHPDQIAPIAATTKDIPPITYPTTPGLWRELHKRALESNGENDSIWLDSFARRIPCGACTAHWMQYTKANPPDFANYFAWTVEAHNSVNSKLGKPTPTVDQARSLWAKREN